MYDRLFGKILMDRGLITREQLDEAISVREKLLAIGLDRRIGEILVNRRLISQEVADEIGAQQKTVDSGGGESVLGRLAVQNGLISQAQLNRALELQRAWFQESGVAPTLGYILVEEGLLTVQQLDALIAVQNRVKTRRRAVSGVPERGPAAGAGASAAGAAFDADAMAEAGARPSVNYHVRTQISTEDGTRMPTERVLTGAALRAMIRKGEIGPSVLARREDQSAVRPLGDFAEFTTAFEQNDRYRATTIRRVQTQPARRAGTWQRVAMVVLLALCLAFCFWLGRNTAPATGGSRTRAAWTAGDLLRYLPEDAAESVSARVWVDRYRARHGDGGEATDVQQFMAGMGLELTVTLTGQRCYTPMEEAAMLREWAAKGDFVDSRLQPFEFPDGIVYGVPETNAGVRLADGTLLALDPEQLKRQVGAWTALSGARAAIFDDQPPRERVTRHLQVADQLDEVGWHRHARRERLAAWQILPEDPRVRARLGFIAPGEDPDDPTGARVLPLHELPSLPTPDPPEQQIPAPWTAPGMAGATADPYPDPPPWVQLMPLVGLEDVLAPAEPVPDPEALRHRDGYVQYLGHWLPRGPFERWWPTARHPSRQVIRSGAAGRAEVWTDLPQFRHEIVHLVRDLFPRLTEYLRLHLREVVPWERPDQPDESRVPRNLLSTPCFLVVVGPGEPLPLWVERGVPGAPTRVELTDMRSLDGLVMPIARGCFSAFIAASWGTGLPAWMREAMADDLALRFAGDALLDEWRLLADNLQAEYLLTPLPGSATADEDPMARLFAGACDTAAERAAARGVYRVLLERSRRGTGNRLAILHDAVAADDRLALEDETRRLAQGLDGVPWTSWLRELALTMSEQMVPALPLHPANTRALSAAHLEVLARTSGHTRFYSHVTGLAAPRTGHGIPGAIQAGYSLRELLGLAALAARLRVIALGGRTARDQMRELRQVFAITGRADWSAATTSALDRLPPADPDRRTGEGSEGREAGEGRDD